MGGSEQIRSDEPPVYVLHVRQSARETAAWELLGPEGFAARAGGGAERRPCLLGFTGDWDSRRHGWRQERVEEGIPNRCSRGLDFLFPEAAWRLGGELLEGGAAGEGEGGFDLGMGSRLVGRFVERQRLDVGFQVGG